MHQTLAAAAKRARRPSAKRAVPAGEPLRFRAVSVADANALNLFYRRRGPAAFELGGEALSAAATWPPPRIGTDGLMAIDFTLDGAPGRLCLARATVERWLSQADPGGDAGALAPEHAALLLESFLADEIGRLEKHLEGTLELASVGVVDGVSDPSFVLAVEGEAKRRETWLLHADSGLASKIGKLLDAASPEQAELQPDLPLPVAFQWGAAVLSAGELRSLRPGDVVMTDGRAADAQAIQAVFAQRLIASVQPEGKSGRLLSSPTPIDKTRWGWTMDEEKAPAEQPDEAGFEDLPVTIVFELGRTTMPLGEISRLSAGSLISLPDISEVEVDLLANGKRIGRGEIVKIGEGVGVRIVRVFGNA
jgi:type III secretion protein Q